MANQGQPASTSGQGGMRGIQSVQPPSGIPGYGAPPTANPGQPPAGMQNPTYNPVYATWMQSTPGIDLTSPEAMASQAAMNSYGGGFSPGPPPPTMSAQATTGGGMRTAQSFQPQQVNPNAAAKAQVNPYAAQLGMNNGQLHRFIAAQTGNSNANWAQGMPQVNAFMASQQGSGFTPGATTGGNALGGLGTRLIGPPTPAPQPIGPPGFIGPPIQPPGPSPFSQAWGGYNNTLPYLNQSS